jgi:hypothetical protein
MKLLRLALLTAGLAVAPVLRAEPTAPPAVGAPATFLRAIDVPEKTRALQTASVEYHPARGTGPTVWLVGVAHLGTAEYYQAMQQRLDRQTVVLYEGIGIHDVKKGPGTVGDAGVQTTLAKALGLKFQLDAIDYRHPSFVNSDLHVPEIEEEVKKREPAAGGTGDETFDQLVEALQGTGAMGGALTQMIGTLGATPQMREMTKTMLIEVLGQAGELLGMARTAAPEMKDLFDVILTQRNDVVMRDLRTQLGKARAGDSIAVFYGAAHMDELATHLRDELHYEPVKTEWDTAFTADSAQSGISPEQMRMMIDLMRSQLQAAPK